MTAKTAYSVLGILLRKGVLRRRISVSHCGPDLKHCPYMVIHFYKDNSTADDSIVKNERVLFLLPYKEMIKHLGTFKWRGFIIETSIKFSCK